MSEEKKGRDEWWEKHYESLRNDKEVGKNDKGRSEVHSQKSDGLGAKGNFHKLESEHGLGDHYGKKTVRAVKYTISPNGITKEYLDSLAFDVNDIDFGFTIQDYAYDIVDEAIDILLSKHEDYGPLNISNAPGGPLNGLAVRLHDKVSRLANLISTGSEPNHESLRDTFIDIINYAVIGILVSEDHWE